MIKTQKLSLPEKSSNSARVFIVISRCANRQEVNFFLSQDKADLMFEHDANLEVSINANIKTHVYESVCSYYVDIEIKSPDQMEYTIYSIFEDPISFIEKFGNRISLFVRE